jgi:hypothetical protein
MSNTLPPLEIMPEQGFWEDVNHDYDDRRYSEHYEYRCPLCHSSIHVETDSENGDHMLLCDQDDCHWRWSL